MSYFIDEDLALIVYTRYEEELELKWKILENSNDFYIFQRYSWNKYWSDIFSEIYSIHIHVLQRNDVPVAIFPFCINKKGIVRILQFIGGDQSDYLTPVLPNKFNLSLDTFKLILIPLKDKYDLILFEKIPDYIKNIKNSFVNCLNAELSDYSFGINLPETYLEFQNSLKSKFRNDNKRNLKRLYELGSIEFEKIQLDLDNKKLFVNLLKTSLEQKTRRIRNYLGSSFLEQEAVQEFYKKSYLLIDDEYKLDFTLLTLNNEIILATHWGFYDKDRFYYIFPTMEGKDWYKYSCGKVLLNYLIEYSISENKKYFDLTMGDEKYKKDWSNHQMSLFSFRKARTFKGFIYVYLYMIFEYVKKNKSTRSFWKFIKSIIIKSRKKK